MTFRRQLKVAMIGQGFMGRAHSNAFHQVGHFCESPYDLKLKVICGRNQQRLIKVMAARWGWEEVSSDWEAVVERRDVDVIDICTRIICMLRLRFPPPKRARLCFVRNRSRCQ
jgi:predicted dehydrogenase